MSLLKQTKKYALDVVGGLSAPSKMPGMGWSIPAAECNRGSQLRKVEGTACHGCYACKGRYVFPNVQAALYNRLESIQKTEWVSAMIFLLKDQEYFRWFDSGDLQDWTMLKKISEVCEATPNCKHWLPTREFGIIRTFLKKGNTIPDNLTIRLSSDMVNELPVHSIPGVPFSTISTKTDTFDHLSVNNCPVAASKTIKSCDDAGKCRKCWDKTALHVNYKKH